MACESEGHERGPEVTRFRLGNSSSSFAFLFRRRWKRKEKSGTKKCRSLINFHNMISSRAVSPRAKPFYHVRDRHNVARAVNPSIPKIQSNRRRESKTTQRSSSTPSASLLRRTANLDLLLVVRSSPPQKFNPQNTEDPLIVPSPSLTATEAVEVQLRALEKDDEPWPGHGVQVREKSFFPFVVKAIDFFFLTFFFKLKTRPRISSAGTRVRWR